jgi:hypothetical protein
MRLLARSYRAAGKRRRRMGLQGNAPAVTALRQQCIMIRGTD